MKTIQYKSSVDGGNQTTMETQTIKELQTIANDANVCLSDLLTRDRETIKALYLEGKEDQHMSIALCNLQLTAERLEDTCQLLIKDLREIRKLKDFHDLYEHLVLGKPLEEEHPMSDDELGEFFGIH